MTTDSDDRGSRSNWPRNLSDVSARLRLPPTPQVSAWSLSGPGDLLVIQIAGPPAAPLHANAPERRGSPNRPTIDLKHTSLRPITPYRCVSMKMRRVSIKSGEREARPSRSALRRDFCGPADRCRSKGGYGAILRLGINVLFISSADRILLEKDQSVSILERGILLSRRTRVL